MPKKICVYTCITGDYDSLHEVELIEKNVDYLCFTNNKALKSRTWKIIHIENDGLNNHHLSRKIKMLGHPIISNNYDISIWMDASIVWQKPILDFVKMFFVNTNFAAFRHNHNNSIQEEAKTCLLHNKDTKENILKTLDYLNSNHFPDNLGLYEMTVFIKNHNDPKVQKTMALWFELNKTLSKRDQLEFMYAIWKTGLNVTPINLNVWDNDFFTHHLHNNTPITNSFHVYYGNSDSTIDFNKHFSYTYHIADNVYSAKIKIPLNAKCIEIYFTNSRGVIMNDFKIDNQISSVSYVNCIQNKNKKLFYSTFNVVKVHGNFSKGQKLSFSINMSPASQIELLENIEYLQSAFYNKILENQKLNQLLALTNNDKAELDRIKKSKSWRIIQKAKIFLRPYNKK